MFGIKRSNLELDTSKDIIINKAELIPPNEQDSIYDSTKYIFYDDQNKFQTQLELFIILTNYNKKIVILLDGDSNFEELQQALIKKLKGLTEFKSIDKLTPENFYKINNGNKIPLLTEGKIKDFVKSGDNIYCFLNTDEFWIKTYYDLTSYNFKKIIKLEYKLKKKMRYKKLKIILMKGGIQYFVDNIKNTKYCDFNYYLKNFEFKIKKHEKTTTHNDLNRRKNKLHIDKIINHASEIIVKIKFGIFEKLVHDHLKSCKLENSNFLRLNEYSDLIFEDLMNETKYLPEYTTIKEITDDFLANQNNNNNPKFLFFSRRKKKGQKNKLFSSKKNINLLEEQKPIDEVKDEDDEKDKINQESLGINQINEIKPKKSVKSKNTIIHTTNNKIENDNSIIKINDIITSNIEINKHKKKKERIEKIKNIIIISKQMIKEEKRPKKRFTKMISHSDILKINDFSKGIFNSKKKLSASNKNVVLSDYNINTLSDKNNNESIKYLRNENQGSSSDYYINIDNEIKPKSFNEKKGFLIFGDNKITNEGLNDLLLDDQQNEGVVFKDKYQTSVSTKKVKGNNDLNIATTEPYYEDISNSDDDNKSDFKTQHPKKVRKTEKIHTMKYNTKKAFFLAFKNRNKNVNVCDELKSNFDSEYFILNMNKAFNNIYTKITIEKIKMPEIKDTEEYLDKEHKFLIGKKKDKHNFDIKLGNRFHVCIFMMLLLIFLVLFLLFLNLDFFSIYFGIE